ncbi:MAG: lysozyme inhibitor LprI family protein [Chthoniobacteraceae bacterium]
MDGSYIHGKRLVLAGLLLFPFTLLAQDDAFSDADAQLNSAYHEALNNLPPRQQELLRKAERAWIPFSDKLEAALNAMKDDQRLSDDVVQAAVLREVRNRAKHLQTFFGHDPRPEYPMPTEWKRQDDFLGKGYSACMHRLSPDQQHLLRDAERAWIVYRDADLTAVSAVQRFVPDAVRNAAAVDLTEAQNFHLSVIASSGSVSSAATSQVASSANEPPAKQAEAMAGWKKKASALLQGWIEAKDNSFFKEPKAFANLPPLPSDFTASLSDLDAQWVGLSRSCSFSDLISATSPEYPTVQLLKKWQAFSISLKSDDVSLAGRFLASGLKQKPTTDDYHEVWKIVEGWDQLYQKVAASFQDHVTKAESLAAVGKTAEAIQEYQAALDLIENAPVAKRIKQLRDDSLGL